MLAVIMVHPKRGTDIVKNLRQAGFTLIELMVTILIAAILMTIAVPSFNTYQANQSVRSAAQDLMSTLNFARSEAVKRSVTVTIAPVTPGSWIGGWTVSAGGSTFKNYGPVRGVTISTPASNPVYNRDGRLTTSALSLTVAPASASVTSRCVSVSPSGKPTDRTGGC